MPPGSAYAPILKIKGKNYHTISTLLPEEGQPRKFAQIYIHDDQTTNEDEANRRQEIHRGYGRELDLPTLRALTDLIKTTNPYVQSLKAISELPQNMITNHKFILNATNKPSAEHNRRYNLPESNEVSLVTLNDSHDNADVVVFYRSPDATEIGQINAHRTGNFHRLPITIQQENARMQRISDMNRAFDPLHFVIPFPYGDDGWHKEMRLTKADGSDGGPMTPTQFYGYILSLIHI